MTVAIAPLAVDTDAANPVTASGGLDTIVRAPEPWLVVTLVPDIASPWPSVPLACDTVDEKADSGPPASQASARLVVEASPVTTPASTMEPAAELAEVALPDTAPTSLMEPVAPLVETAPPASTPINPNTPVAADAVEAVPARTATRDTVPVAAD
jgi:hypothetical protein